MPWEVNSAHSLTTPQSCQDDLCSSRQMPLRTLQACVTLACTLWSALSPQALSPAYCTMTLPAMPAPWWGSQ